MRAVLGKFWSTSQSLNVFLSDRGIESMFEAG